MAKEKKSPRTEFPDTEPDRQTEDRKKELVHIEDIETDCQELMKTVIKGFTDQWNRSNEILDFWDVYNCQLGPKQFYSGNSKIFVPIVHDAVNARKTRFVNQIFPQSGKHVEVTANEDHPQGVQSLLEYYIRKAKLRTKTLPALVRNGDIEGQYTVYMHWTRNKRHVVQRIKKAPNVEGVLFNEAGEFDDMEDQVIEHAYPTIEVIADPDFLVLPQNAESLQGALDDGGSVSIIRRWSKAKLKRMIAEEEIDEERGKQFIETLSTWEKEHIPDKNKSIANALGIQMKGGKSPAMLIETWTMLAVEGERRMCRIYFGAEDMVLSVKRNPYWCDKLPILSSPVERVQGTFKGAPKIKFVETMQYAANDAINEGMDSASYALLPIVMTDPMRNPRSGSMVLNVGAIWEVDPKSTQFAQFPQLWKEAFQIVQASKDQVFQTMGVNPAMMPQQATAPGKKPNQAQIANEQQVDILTTADAVTTIEGEILSPALQWFVYLDHQFRDKAMTIRAFGKPGIKAAMEEIEPIQMDRRFEFRWFGVEAARNAQQMQMQMAGLNALRSIPPQMYPGFEMNLAPVIQQWVENLFGPRLAMDVFTDVKAKLTLDPKFENELLQGGFELPVHPMDDDRQHMMEHQKLMQQGDESGNIRIHMMMHQQQMQKRQQAMMQQQLQQMMGPILQQAMQQRQGQPRSGAATQKGRNQGPPGMVPQQQMPLAMPRAARG